VRSGGGPGRPLVSVEAPSRREDRSGSQSGGGCPGVVLVAATPPLYNSARREGAAERWPTGVPVEVASPGVPR
jgi:hypothetical protein